MTRARADKGARVRAMSDKGRGHNNDKREGGRGEEACSYIYFHCNILIRKC